MAVETVLDSEINSLPLEVAKVVNELLSKVRQIESYVQDTVDLLGGNQRTIAQVFINDEIMPLYRFLSNTVIPSLTPEQQDVANLIKNKIRDMVQAQLAKYPDPSVAAPPVTPPEKVDNYAGIPREKVDAFELEVAPITTLLDELEGLVLNPSLRTQYIVGKRTDVISMRSKLTNSAFQNTYGELFAKSISLIQQRINNAVSTLDDLLPRVEEIELENMPFFELVELVLKEKADPYLFGELRKPHTDAKKQMIATIAQRRLFGSRREGVSSAENQEREVALVYLQMHLMSDKLQYQGEKASGQKWAETTLADKTTGSALEGSMEDHLVSREEWLRVTAYNQEWGSDFRQLLDAVTVQVALKSVPPGVNSNTLPTVEEARGELSASNDERKVIMTKKGQLVLFKGRFYLYNPAISYESLTDDKTGRASLRKFFESFRVVDDDATRTAGSPVYRESHKRAVDFAELAYTSLTLIDDSFEELQASTQTGAHNEGEKNKLFVFNPLSTCVHAVERYKKPAYWLQMMYAYYNLNEIPGHYFLSDPVKEKMLWRIEQFKRHQKVYFDTPFFGNLKPPAFLETIFPTTRAFVELQKSKDHEGKVVSEYLWVASKDHPDREVLVDSDNTIWAQRADSGEVYSADGNALLGKISGAMSSVSSASSVDSSVGTAEDSGILFTDISGNVSEWANTSIKQRVGGVERKIPLGKKPTNRGLYWTAFKGIERAMNLTFAAFPANLSKHQILEDHQSGKGGMLNELFTAWGMAKMFPSEGISTLLEPILGHYVFRLLSAFPSRLPEERVELITEMIEQLGQTGSYGGLGSEALAKQVEAIIKSLTTTSTNGQRQVVDAYRNKKIERWKPGGRESWEEVVDFADSVRPAVDYRQPELIEYLIAYWQHEKRGVQMPPIGMGLTTSAQIAFWRKSQTIGFRSLTPDQESLIRQAQWLENMPLPPINRTIDIFKIGGDEKH